MCKQNYVFLKSTVSEVNDSVRRKFLYIEQHLLSMCMNKEYTKTCYKVPVNTVQ